MKFSVSSKSLYNIASAAGKIISSKNTLQILNNFLFILEGDTLTVKGQDMENRLEGRIAVTDVEGSGSFCLNALRLVELLKLMPDQGIRFEVSESLDVRIEYSNGIYNTVAIAGEEFPRPDAALTAGQETVEFVSPASAVIAGMDNTIFAAGTDEIRPQMMGVLWDIKTDCLVFVATDTRKLVRFTNTAVQPGIECSFILPVKGATILKNVFSKAENVKVTVSAVNVVFESEDFTFDCRLIKGRFPDYNKVIPRNNPYAVTVDCHSFLNSVRRVAIGGDDGSNLIKFNFHDSSLTLSSIDQGYNTSSQEDVQCSYDGPDMLIGFDSSFLIEILSTFSCPDIVMHIGDPSRPALLAPAENAPDTDLTIILMPMTINS